MEIKLELTKAQFENIKLKMDAIGLYAALEYHNLYKKYVPYKEGILQNTVNITPWQIIHTQPYAHYQYMGKVYGPNIPMFSGGAIVGFRSIPKSEKHPTGKSLTYRNPTATAHWNENVSGEEVAQIIAEFISYKM